MVQKVVWKGTKDWEEWLWIWEKNEKGEFSRDGVANFDIAIGLLHVGLDVIEYELRIGAGPGGRPINPRKVLAAIKFYLRMAEWMDFDWTSFKHKIGRKAYEVMIHQIWRYPFPSFLKRPNPAPSSVSDQIFEQLADFFAKDRKEIYEDDRRPYRADMEELLTELWSIVKGKTFHHFNFTKETVLGKKEEIIRALVNAELFDLILRDQIFEAIPVLEEKISNHIFPGVSEQGKREIWMKELENFKPWAMMNEVLLHKEGKLLLELLIKRTAIKKIIT